MFSPRLILLAVLFFNLSYQGASALHCNAAGIVISCPTVVDKSDEMFCCKSSISDSLEVCCDFEDYVKQNVGVLAGIIVGGLIFIIIVTLCCCCFCSCCCLAKRRVQRGTVIYGPLHAGSTTYSISTHPVVHVPPNTSHFVAPPPPPYPSANYPPYQQQPPSNPGYS